MPDAEQPTDRTSHKHSVPLEDYALLSDLHTGPLVSREGSIDWLCFPNFDSPAVFSAILGTPDDGRWQLMIDDGEVVSRRYRGSTFITETHWRGPTGEAIVVDLLPAGDSHADLIRQVQVTRGTVIVRHDLRLRPDYNRAGLWLRQCSMPEGDAGIIGIAGPEMLVLRGPLLSVADNGDSHHLEEEGESGQDLSGTFELSQGESTAWVLSWSKSYDDVPPAIEIDQAIAATEKFWTDWNSHIHHQDGRAEMIDRSLLVLQALTHVRTGGLVAAPTTSLPEEFGGSRNWDYRFTWLRDAALSIETLIDYGYTNGARAWRDWLLRAVAGEPSSVQIMYGLDGRRELPEIELDHLAGYEDSSPVRIGNGAVDQYQADVLGEVLIALAALRDAGEKEDRWSWGLQKHLLQFCVDNLDRPDHGIWEMRGESAFFTHGRVMMWAAFNEGIRAVEQYGADPDDPVSATDAELAEWRACRDRLRSEVIERGWNRELQSFVQTYEPSSGYTEVDASLLQLPHTGFIAADDPKMLATVARIEQDLVDEHGFVHRYRTASGLDGLTGGEHTFLLCLGWLAEQYALSGRLTDAEKSLDLLDECASDLGLFAEEYNPATRRMAGNFPQAYSHLGYARAASALLRARRHN